MKVLIKGAGDLASGAAARLHACGIQLVMTELAIPRSVRRTVSFSRAVYEGFAEVEGIRAEYCSDIVEIEDTIKRGNIAVTTQKAAEIIEKWGPDAVVDAILAKRNTGTTIDEAPIVVGVGPGFTAGVDCHCAVETKRGHYLGRCIYEGSPIAFTGIPGNIGGYTTERVLRAPVEGVFYPLAAIGDYVKAGDICGEVAAADENGVERRYPVVSQIEGIVRGLLQPGVPVLIRMKSGDVDPRCEKEHCYTISDKARSVGGGVTEAVFHLYNQQTKR